MQTVILNKGGSVGAYIKEPFTYVEFGDIINLDKSAEHYWLEVSGLKKQLASRWYLLSTQFYIHGKRE